MNFGSRQCRRCGGHSRKCVGLSESWKKLERFGTGKSQVRTYGEPAPCSLCTVNKPVPASTMELFGVANVMALWAYKAEVPSSSNTRTAQERERELWFCDCSEESVAACENLFDGRLPQVSRVIE